MWADSTLVTLALVIFFSSILVFFSQDVGRLLKLVFSIPGVKLLLPLALASWIINIYEDWGRWLLLWFQSGLHIFLNKLTILIPFEKGSMHLIRIVFLFCMASIPLWVYQLKSKKKGHRIPPTPFTYWLGLLLWILATVLLTVS